MGVRFSLVAQNQTMMSTKERGVISEIAVVIIVVLLTATIFTVYKQKAGGPITAKLQICPDEWYQDKLPTVREDKNLPQEYFVMNGERREVDEFDLPWVKKNCGLTLQSVY